MVNTFYNSTKGTIKKLQSSKGRTNLKFSKIISSYFNEMNIRRQSGIF